MIIKRAQCHYFDDLATYIIAVVSTTLMFEIHKSENGASPYRKNDRMVLDAKQLPKRLKIYPYDLLDTFFKQDKWPQELRIEEEDVKLPPKSAVLGTGIFERILALYSSVLGNYYEKNIDVIRSKFGDDAQIWPTVWNFGRVVRNAFYHNNCIKIDNKNAKVSWKNLSYDYSDNGKVILNTDIWPADLIYLMIEMDKHL